MDEARESDRQIECRSADDGLEGSAREDVDERERSTESAWRKRLSEVWHPRSRDAATGKSCGRRV